MTRVVRDDAMLTARDVASQLNINISTVRRWTNRGILKTYRIGPRGDRRFRREDVALFVVEQSDEENCDKVVL